MHKKLKYNIYSIIQTLLNYIPFFRIVNYINNIYLADEIVLVLEYCPHGQIHKILKGLPECCFPESLASQYIK